MQDKKRPVRDMVSYYIDNGEYQKAQEMMSTFRLKDYSYDYENCELARKLAYDGKIIKALVIVNSLTNSTLRESALVDIAGTNSASISKMNREEINTIVSTFLDQGGKPEIELIMN